MNDIDSALAGPASPYEGPQIASPITSPPAPQSAEYLTRRQAADYIRAQLGRPMSFSTAQKLAALGEFAEPALYWGRRPLYRREDLERWAEGRSAYRCPSSPSKV